MKKFIYFLLMFAMLPFIAFAADDLEKSASVSGKWLKLVDSGKYEQSWNETSIILKVKFPKTSWIAYLENIRKPLGSMKSRNVMDQRVATNPPNMPPGHYVVMVYQTEFSKKNKVTELVVLRKSDDQRLWQVLTYQLN